jgi:hypothetical protein
MIHLHDLAPHEIVYRMQQTASDHMLLLYLLLLVLVQPV